MMSLVGKALRFTHKLSLLFFLSIHRAQQPYVVDGHQMYFGGSVVGKASTIGVYISPTPLS